MNPILSLPAFVAALPTEFSSPVTSSISTLAGYVWSAAVAALSVYFAYRLVCLVGLAFCKMMGEAGYGLYSYKNLDHGSEHEEGEAIRAEWAAIGYDGNAFNPDGSEASHEDNAWRKMEWNRDAGPDEQMILNDAEVDALWAGSDPTVKPFDNSGYQLEFDSEGNQMWVPAGGEGISDDSADDDSGPSINVAERFAAMSSDLQNDHENYPDDDLGEMAEPGAFWNLDSLPSDPDLDDSHR